MKIDYSGIGDRARDDILVKLRLGYTAIASGLYFHHTLWYIQDTIEETL